MTVADELPYPAFAAITAQGSSLLTREQEHLLAIRARDGDHRARGELVERNLRLVVKLAAEHAQRAPQLELQDLVSEGVLGLMHAIEKFDPHSGFKLSTYATWWIKQALRRAIDRDGTVTMPIDLRRELRASEHHLRETLGREPTTEQLMNALSPQTRTRFDAHELAAARAALQCASLDRPATTPDGTGTSLAGLVADPHSADPADLVSEAMDLRADVAAATASLARDERALIEHRFGLQGREPATLAAAADDLGIDRSAARQLERQAVRRMREAAGVSEMRGEPCRPAAALRDLLGRAVDEASEDRAAMHATAGASLVPAARAKSEST